MSQYKQSKIFPRNLLGAQSNSRMKEIRGSIRLYELAFIVVAVVLLMTVFLTTVWNLQIRAEASTVEAMVSRMQSGLNIYFVKTLLRGGALTLAEFKCFNPMTLLSKKPVNYMGVLRDANPATIEPGHWYYDEQDCKLIYIVKNHDAFVTKLVGMPRAQFRVYVSYTEGSGTEPKLTDGMDKQWDKSTISIVGLKILSLESYGWK